MVLAKNYMTEPKSTALRLTGHSLNPIGSLNSSVYRINDLSESQIDELG